MLDTPRQKKNLGSLFALAIMTFIYLTFDINPGGGGWFDTMLDTIDSGHEHEMISTRRRRLTQEEVHEVTKMKTWVEDTAKNFNGDQKRRFLAILKTRWPECVNDGLTSSECKDLVDNEIQNTNLFTDNDKDITTHILHTRSLLDTTYNAVVIRVVEGSGRVVGVYRDGLVYYDFPWDGTGTGATEEQQRDIPSVNGINVPGGTIDEWMSGIGPIVIEDRRKLRGGESRRKLTQYEESRALTTYVPKQYNKSVIISGGTYHLNYTDAHQIQEEFDTFMATDASIAPAGERAVGPWNCTGLSGVSCCAKIKHSVRDQDTRGSAIQCWIEVMDGLLTVKTCEDDLTKVCIYETWDNMVYTVPILAYYEVLLHPENAVNNYDPNPALRVHTFTEGDVTAE